MHINKKAGTAQLEFSLCFGAGLCQGRGDTYTLPLSLDSSFKGGRTVSVLVNFIRVSKTVSVQTTATDHEFRGRDEKKKVSLTYFSSIVTNPLTASREGLKFCVSAGGMEFGRNKQK